MAEMPDWYKAPLRNLIDELALISKLRSVMISLTITPYEDDEDGDIEEEIHAILNSKGEEQGVQHNK